VSTHYTADELADAAAGVLTPDQTAEVDRHVVSCPDCSGVAAVQTVRSLLAEDAAPMPDQVFARLDAAVTAEAGRRSSGEAAVELATRQAEHAKRLSTGTFGQNAPTKRHTGIAEVDSPGASQPNLTS